MHQSRQLYDLSMMLDASGYKIRNLGAIEALCPPEDVNNPNYTAVGRSGGIALSLTQLGEPLVHSEMRLIQTCRTDGLDRRL